jgi:hypothetical protein
VVPTTTHPAFGRVISHHRERRSARDRLTDVAAAVLALVAITVSALLLVVGLSTFPHVDRRVPMAGALASAAALVFLFRGAASQALTVYERGFVLTRRGRSLQVPWTSVAGFHALTTRKYKRARYTLTVHLCDGTAIVLTDAIRDIQRLHAQLGSRISTQVLAR